MTRRLLARLSVKPARRPAFQVKITDPNAEAVFGNGGHVIPASLSGEHRAYRWLPYAEASTALRWESNRAAMAELHRKLTAA